MASDIHVTIEQLALRIAGLDYEREQDRLADIWRLTQLLLIDNIERLVREAPGKLPEQMWSLVAESSKRFRAAETASMDWTRLNVPSAWKAGMKQAQQQLAEQGIERGIGASMSVINKHAVGFIASDTMQDLLRASQTVQTNVRQALQRAVMDETRRAVAGGFNQQAAGKRIADSLTEQGVFAVQDKRGRNIPIDRYAEIVANVKLREAHTKGTEANLREHGFDLVQITAHIHRPDKCSPYEGKVFSLDGRTPGYPVLDLHTPFHPGCRHSETPYVIANRSDAENERIREESNRSGQITVYSKRDMDALISQQDRNQKRNRIKRALMKADEKAIAAGTMPAPKSAQWYERSLTARVTVAMKRLDEAISRREQVAGFHQWSDKHSGPWIDSLTQEERDAARYYKRRGYAPINSALRDGGPLSPEAQEVIGHLDSAILKGALKEDTVLFRSFAMPERLQQGQIWSDPGFMSTSRDERVAQRIADRHLQERKGTTYLFEIHAPKNMPAGFPDGLAVSKEEFEATLPRDVRWRILDVQPGGAKRATKVTVEWAP